MFAARYALRTTLEPIAAILPTRAPPVNSPGIDRSCDTTRRFHSAVAAGAAATETHPATRRICGELRYPAMRGLLLAVRGDR